MSIQKHPEQFFSAGTAAIISHRYPQAIKAFNCVLKLNPHHPPSYFNLGIIYERLGDQDTAITYFKRAIHHQPLYDKAMLGLANLYFAQNQAAQATHYFHAALEINPNLPEAYAYLGLIADSQHQLTAAKDYYRQGLLIAPHHPLLMAYNLALAYKLHDYPTINQFKMPVHKCIDKHLKLDQNPGPTPFISLILTANPQTNLQVAQWWSHHHQIKPARRFPKRNTPFPIRLGYLSYDFRDHVIGRLIARLFNHHSSGFQTYLYSLAPPEPSDLYRRFCQLPGFIDLYHQSPSRIIDRIRQDHIDILIDLTGYTKGGRPEICAARAAPIQINYLGFPGSSGADFYDYIIGDSTLIPPSHESLYSEKILRLPWYLITSYPKNHSSFIIHHSSSVFTFACLANPVKIHSSTLKVWFNILKQVPLSRLLLQSENSDTIQNIRTFASKNNFPPGRIIFLSRQTYPDYLKQLSQIDLYLDPFHYNGGGTTADLLYRGVPVITLSGHRYVERMGAAILTAAGLPELITHSQKKYIDLAVTLAKDPQKILNLKSYLLNHKSDLFDTKSWVQNLEHGLEAVWSRHLNGLPPTHITVKP